MTVLSNKKLQRDFHCPLPVKNINVNNKSDINKGSRNSSGSPVPYNGWNNVDGHLAFNPLLKAIYREGYVYVS